MNQLSKPQKYDRFKSTRMTPLYLMQQDEVKPEDQELIRLLSPYSMKQDMIKLADKFPDANISVEVIGRTAEYNDIVMLKVSERNSGPHKYFRADDNKYIDEVPEKKIIFIVHGLSVMGISSLNCLKILLNFKALLSYYFAHLDKFDMFIIPMANPDGFNRQIQDNYLWNKNMSPQHACSGVNLDRNFDVAWNHSHATSSCSQHYPGTFPFSEPETKAIKEVLHLYSHKMVAYFHVHASTYSFHDFKGDAVLYPKGYSEEQSDDDKYIDLRSEVDEALRNASFEILSVTVDTLHNWYGRISGSSVDYASTVYGIPFAMELAMQPYFGLQTSALEEIWRRVIDVVFKNIWRSIKNNDEK